MKIEITPSHESNDKKISTDQMKKIIAAANYLHAVSGFKVEVKYFNSETL